MSSKDNNWIDKHLRFSIATYCNKSEEEITKQFLGTLKELNLSDKKIKNLNGIEYANSLSCLILNNNNIKDTSLLSNLVNLRNLELSKNKITDASFLSHLKKLRSINLDYNNISNIPNLSDLKALNLMNISNNKVQDFSFINSLKNNDFKIIASDQLVLLNPIYVDIESDFNFEPLMLWEEDKLLCYDNVQVIGDYDDVETNERPSLLYSISKILIKNIRSNCLITADFYHEVPFFKSGLLSGVLFQPLILKVSNPYFNLDKANANLYSITGKLILNNSDVLKNKIVTIIDSMGNKYYSKTNSNGIYTFNSLREDRYTLLFPFLSEYDYITPSLYVINLKEEKIINIDGFVSSK